MLDHDPTTPTELIGQAVASVQALLPRDWTLSSAGAVDGGVVLRLDGPGPTSHALIPNVRLTASPRDVSRICASGERAPGGAGSETNRLFIAPWLSTRSRELLIGAGWSYVDFTGNIRLSVAGSPFFVFTEGARHDPQPRSPGTLQLRGARSGRLIRFLCDVRPPYGVRELAAATGMSPGWVSQILGSLDDQALIDRTGRGVVTDLDPTALITRWALSYDVLKSNAHRTYIARNGTRRALQALPDVAGRVRWLVTGSFVAYRVAPVAASAMLMVYTDDVKGLADALGLLPADSGADTVLLSPNDECVWDRPFEAEDIPAVGLSHAAVDCLTGNGRMPSEGVALLEWMSEHEDVWRIGSIRDL